MFLEFWNTGQWITPAIHGYALIVLVLGGAVYHFHRTRLLDLARRIGTLASRIERRPADAPVKLEQMDGLMLHLGEIVERRADVDAAAVLDFVRHEESQRGRFQSHTLAPLVETMIEIFPLLGIFGTVWGIAGVSQADLTGPKLLVLFGTAVGTTLYALLYAIVYRIAYSAIVVGKVVALEDHYEKFDQFIAQLEKRTRSFDLGAAAGVDPWSAES